MKAIFLFIFALVTMVHALDSFAYNCEDAVMARTDVHKIGLVINPDGLDFIQVRDFSNLTTNQHLNEGEDYGVLDGPTGSSLFPTAYGRGRGHGFFRRKGINYGFTNFNPSSRSDYYEASLNAYYFFDHETVAEISYPKLDRPAAGLTHEGKRYVLLRNKNNRSEYFLSFEGEEIIKFTVGDEINNGFRRVEILVPKNSKYDMSINEFLNDPFILAAAGALQLLIFKPIPKLDF